MMLRRALLATALAASLLVARDAGAICMMIPLHPMVLTTRVTALPADGGVLVGAGRETYGDDHAPSSSDPSEAPRWHAVAAGREVALTRVSLAPGLAVLHAATTGSFTIKTAAGTKVSAFTRDAKAASVAMPAPKITRIETGTSITSRWSSSWASATFAEAPPADAIAIITYAVRPAGNVALSYAYLPARHDKLTTLNLARTGGHCSNNPAGYAAPSTGDKVVLAYVDAFGRLSPVSAPVEVQAATPTPGSSGE